MSNEEFQAELHFDMGREWIFRSPMEEFKETFERAKQLIGLINDRPWRGEAAYTCQIVHIYSTGDEQQIVTVIQRVGRLLQGIDRKELFHGLNFEEMDFGMEVCCE